MGTQTQELAQVWCNWCDQAAVINVDGWGYCTEHEAKRDVKWIDVTPTWSGVLPGLLHVYRSSSKAQAVKDVEVELIRMAELADRYVASQKRPDWIGVADANGDIPCSRLAPQRCMWLEGHYGGCATP